ncbi:MAG: hypothetical protein ACRCTN_11070 [Carnobacterium maltaromaticum]
MELTKEEIKNTATKNFNELIESCENLTINQKRVAFKRIIQDEVEPGEVGVLVRQKLSEHLETIDANAGLKLYRLETEKGNVFLSEPWTTDLEKVTEDYEQAKEEFFEDEVVYVGDSLRLVSAEVDDSYLSDMLEDHIAVSKSSKCSIATGEEESWLELEETIHETLG